MSGLKLGALVGTVAFWALLALPSTVLAQDATITGSVTDSTDAVLPGVTVTALHVASGNTFVGVTDAEGQYRIGPVRPGVYKITAELPGFTTVTRENVELLLGQRVAMNIRMSISTVQETVTVTGEAPLVDVGRTRGGGNIDPRQMQELPVLGRNWMDLSMLTPGSRANSVDESPVGGGDSKNFQLNIDGQQVTNMVSSAGFGQPRYSRDLIAEFEMVANRFDATQGRSMQAQVNAITKSGTNRFAGTMSGYFRNDKFNAADFIVRRVLPYSSQQLSGTFGGPIKKDRIHFFGNHEYEREPASYTFTSQFPRFNIPDIRSVRRENKGGARIDTQFTTNTRLMVRGHRYTGDLPNDPRSTGGATLHPTRSAATERTSTQVLSTFTQVMRTNLVHEIKGGYSQFTFGSVGIVPFSPQIQLRGYTIGEQTNYGQYLDQYGYQIRSDWTWLKGRHELKFGGEAMTNTTCVCPWLQFADGSLNATGGAIPRNIEDIFPVWNDVSTWNLAALSPIAIRWEQSVGEYVWKDPKDIYAGYVQDNWTLSRKLTLNLGLRYDISMGSMAEHLVFDPFLPEPRPSEKNMFQPRLGFAYTMTDRTVIRGGFGKYFAEFTDSPNYSTNISIRTVKVLVPNDLRPDFAANPFNGPKPTFEEAIKLPNRSLSSSIVNPTNFKTPYSWQTSIGVQQQLAQTIGVQADYVYLGTRRDQNTRETNLSFNPATGVNYSFNDVSRRPYPGWGNVSMQFSDGRSNRHSIDTGLTKRFSDNWQGSATYSLAWLYDADPLPTWPCFYGPGNFGPCPEGFQVAPDLGGEYGLSSGDQRHRAVFNGIWQLPMGFRASGLYFFGSGSRRSTSFGADLRNRSGSSGRLRPNSTIIPRNTFVGDPIHRVDLRVSRSFPIVARVKVEGIFEAFNVFNHANYGSYVTNESSASYGRPQQDINVAYQPRMLQLGFRVEF